MLGGGGIVGGVNLDCVLTSAGESGMVECFPVRSEGKQREKKPDDEIESLFNTFVS